MNTKKTRVLIRFVEMEETLTYIGVLPKNQLSYSRFRYVKRRFRILTVRKEVLKEKEVDSRLLLFRDTLPHRCSVFFRYKYSVVDLLILNGCSLG